MSSVGWVGRFFQSGSSQARRRCINRQPIGTRSNRCPRNRGTVDFLLLRDSGAFGPSSAVAGSQHDPGAAVARNDRPQRIESSRESSLTGIAEAVEQSLAATRSVRIVVFESPGGDIDEAMRIGRDIKQNGLETGVSTECSSACTYSFIAGRERILLPGGQLGFHACKKTVWYFECENQKVF